MEFLTTYSKDKSSPDFIQLEETIRKNLLKRIRDHSANPPSKQKKLPTCVLTPLPGEQTHRTFIGANDKIYKFNSAPEKGELDELNAFFAEIAGFILGPNHTAGRTRSFGDEVTRGTQQNIIQDLISLDKLVQKKS